MCSARTRQVAADMAKARRLAAMGKHLWARSMIHFLSGEGASFSCSAAASFVFMPLPFLELLF